MRTRLGAFAAMATALALAACLPAPLGGGGSGKVAVAVRWPASAGFTLLAVPEGTRRVDISISGSGLPAEAALRQSLTPQDGRAESEAFLEVPIGPKLVQAQAFDAAGKLLAQGQVQVVVTPNVVVDARIVLQPLGASPLPSPAISMPPASPGLSPSPEASASAVVSPNPLPLLYAQAFAGNGVGERRDASSLAGASFRYPRQLAYDAPRGVLWVADDEGRALRRVDISAGGVSTVYPRPLAASPNASLTAAASPRTGSSPSPVVPTIAGLTVGPDGAVYFADPVRHGIYRFDPNGGSEPQRWAGTAKGYSEGDRLAGAAFNTPMAIAFGPAGEAYVADWGNRRIRRISPGGAVTTVAGTGEVDTRPPTGEAFRTPIGQPGALCLDTSGAVLYVVEPVEARLLKLVLATGTVSVVAGGRLGSDGEDGPAVAAGLSLPLAVAVDGAGQAILADGWGLVVGETNFTGFTSRVLRVALSGRLERLAGQSNQAFGDAGDGGDARSAFFNNPAGLALVPGLGTVVSDAYNHRLRLLAPANAGLPGPSLAPSLQPTPSVSPSPVASPSASLAPSPSSSPDQAASP